jgi:hypothetical protein
MHEYLANVQKSGSTEDSSSLCSMVLHIMGHLNVHTLKATARAGVVTQW